MSMVISTRRVISRTRQTFDYLMPGETDLLAVEISLLGPILRVWSG
jgi:hypothetical protein